MYYNLRTGEFSACKTRLNSVSKAYHGYALRQAGEGVTFTVLDSGNRPVAEERVAVSGGKAEAKWTVRDVREKGETGELKYRFRISASKARPVYSAEISVKNPQIVSMEWEKPVAYLGETVKLRIKSFEVAQLSPVCKLYLHDIGNNIPDEAIPVQDITVDADEKEFDITVDFDTEKTVKKDYIGTFTLTVNIISEDTPIILKDSISLTVQTGDSAL